MENVKICQSCGMEMSKAEEFGTEANGSANQEYCCYCYQNGAFEDPDATLEETVEACIEAYEADTPAGVRALMRDHLSKLKRWAKV